MKNNMNLTNYYYQFPSGLTQNLLMTLLSMVNHILQKWLLQVVVVKIMKKILTKGNLKKSVVKDIQKKRKSDIVWMNDTWIYKEIHPYIHEANQKAGWNFDWDWSESCQFTKYGVGQYYGWHCDSWDKPYSRPPKEDGTRPIDHGKIRKLSVTISLSHPDEYEGGNLEFDFRNQVDWDRNKKAAIHSCDGIRPRGSIIVFQVLYGIE